MNPNEPQHNQQTKGVTVSPEVAAPPERTIGQELLSLFLILCAASVVTALLTFLLASFLGSGQPTGFFGEPYSGLFDYVFYSLLSTVFIAPWYVPEIIAGSLIGLITLQLMQSSKKYIIVGPILAVLLYTVFVLFGDPVLAFFDNNPASNLTLYKVLEVGFVIGICFWTLKNIAGDSLRQYFKGY